MHTHGRNFRVALALLAITLVGAACGDDDGDTTTSAPSDAPAATEPAPYDDPGDTEPSDASAGTPAVEATDSALGEILTSDGRTLYVFTPDDGGAPTCYDDCASNWPPLLAEGDVAVGDGLDAALFDTVAREDGGEQVTVDGWPLYFFASDAEPGDVNGQAVGDIWYVVGPDGTMITDDAG